MKNIFFCFFILIFNCKINPPCSVLDSTCNPLGYFIPNLIRPNQVASTPTGTATGTGTGTATGTGTGTQASTITFAGVSNLRILSATSVELRWTAATSTSAGNMEYNIYRSATSGAQVFTTPVLTVNNVTTATITGITANTNNYYVVRARDSAGTTDTNTAERAALLNGLLRFIPLDATPLATGERINNANVSAVNTPTLTTTDRFGVANNAFLLNGTNQYLTFSVAGLPAASSNRTVCAWSRFDTLSGTHRIISYGAAVADQQFSILRVNLERRVMIFTGSPTSPFDSYVIIPSTELIVGAWNFYCGSLTSSTSINIYFNGTNRIITEQPTVPATNLSFAVIGGSAAVTPTEFINGSVSEVSIWNRVLTPAEILAVFRN